MDIKAVYCHRWWTRTVVLCMATEKTIGNCYNSYYLMRYLLKYCIYFCFQASEDVSITVGLLVAIGHEKSDCDKTPHFHAGIILKLL